MTCPLCNDPSTRSAQASRKNKTMVAFRFHLPDVHIIIVYRYPSSFDAIALVPFNLNPHFLDKTQHPPGFNGETREQRIAVSRLRPDRFCRIMCVLKPSTMQEFHQQNNAPVLGIREGTWLHLHTDSSGAVADVVLHGPHGAVAFLKGQEPIAVNCIDGGVSIKFLVP